MLKWILATLVAVLAVPTWAQQGVEFRPPGAGYRIEFPAQPQPWEESSDPNAPKMYGAELETEGGTLYYGSVYNEMRNPNGNPEAQLDAARDGAVRGNKGSTLRSEQKIMIGGVPARRIIIDVTPDKLVIVQLMAISGGRLYQATWTGPLGRENGPEPGRFLGSFAFVPR